MGDLVCQASGLSVPALAAEDREDESEEQSRFRSLRVKRAWFGEVEVAREFKFAKERRSSEAAKPPPFLLAHPPTPNFNLVISTRRSMSG